MKLKSILLFCFTLLTLAVSAYPVYPRYKEVVTYFFDRYSVQNRTEDQVFKFEKKPSGWVLCINQRYNKQETVKEILIWSAESGKYTEPELIPNQFAKANNEEKEEFLSKWEASHFDACPYFNYRGWDWDVVNTFTEFDKLSDTLLYGVGRAYSSVSSGFLDDNSGLTDLTQSFHLKTGPNQLTSEQLAKYRLYAKKAIEAFSILAKRNPDYETLIGTIGTKVSHEYVTNYLNLLIFQNAEEALKELPDHLYNTLNNNIAKNYLSSCEKNAILFTYGDSDTYPLLYVQAKENFRSDVTVINLSLLQTHPYQEMLRRGNAFTPKVDFSFSPQELDHPKYEVVIIKDDTSHAFSVNKVLSYVKDSVNDYVYETGRYPCIQGKHLEFKCKGNRLKFTLPFGSYMYGGQLLELDLIVNNLGARPIYFTQGVADDAFLGMIYYIRYEGMVYRLQTELNPPSFDGNSIVTESVLHDHLMTSYAFDGLKEARGPDFSNLSNYSIQFVSLVNHYVHTKQNQKALAVADRYFELFTNEILPYDGYSVAFAESYYKLGETAKANAVGKQVIQNLREKPNLHPSLFAEYDSPSKRAKILEELKRLAIEYGQQNFYKDLW